MTNQLENTETLLEKLVAVTERTPEVRRSALDRYFWLFVLVGLIGVPVVTIGFAWGLAAIMGPRPGVSGETVLVLSEIRVNGPIALCPNEYLNFSFDMEVKEAGVYGLDMSVFRTSPPPTLAVFSESQFFVIGSPRTFTVTRHWRIPERYTDKDTQEIVEFIPGDYERNLAVGTTSRNTTPSTRILNFSIRSDCPPLRARGG